MPLNFPNSPTDGQIYTDSTTGNRYSWDNTRQIWKWTPNTVSTSVSSLPPGSPAQGTLWWNTELGRLFIYYVDEDTGQWVEASPVPDINTGISNTVAAAFNTANAALANTNVVLSGNLTSTQGIADRVGDVRNLPIVNQNASYTISLVDNGEVVSITTGNVFVTANVFFAGNTVSVYNNSSANVTITQNTGVTLQWAGLSNTGNRILQQKGLATLVCVAANTFVLSGAGFVA
jgi:peroxiredoxin